jgi:hypothetical protein
LLLFSVCFDMRLATSSRFMLHVIHAMGIKIFETQD